jgi:hypothetical protein
MAARRLSAALALALAAGALAAGCGGSPRDLGVVQPRSSFAPFGGPWTLVEIGGFVPGAGAQRPEFVEIDPDGRAMTIFFLGGNTGCYGVAGVDVQRRDPAEPEVTIWYGMRFGVLGCTAEGTFLALRHPLDPPFVR